MSRTSLQILFTLTALFFFLSRDVRVAAGVNMIRIDATGGTAPLETGYLRMGGTSPSGYRIEVNNRYLTLDGKPWLPVMGEFHYSRYPESHWEEELLKMKAGGIQIVATYVFWIHHEEIEGQFDWTGQRNLRKFIELCGKHGLYAHIRIGPWAHGEVRNGGLPDWLLKKGPTRRNDPAYLSYTRRYFGEISCQVKGLLWKDGGPVIGVQLENEYGYRGPDEGAAHIARLKALALQSGLDVPLFTITGWPDPDFPPGEVIPVYGSYPDNFWDGSLTDLPPSDSYLFNFGRPTTNPNVVQGESEMSSGDIALSHAPYFMAEAGGGMQTSYHRRPVLNADDIPAVTLVQLGSGVNLYGYYMFHGGANPDGKLTTLQESQLTDYPNDLPVISYDFQAPLGQYGQMHPSFRRLKSLHLFLNTFGEALDRMRSVRPEVVPSGPRDLTAVRVAARAEGGRAFIFVNNYLHNYPLPARKDSQIALKLPSETITIPRRPITIPSNAYFIWPVNLDLDGALLKFATVQPLTKIDMGNVSTYFFFEIPGIAPEFSFAEDSVDSLLARRCAVTRADGCVYINGTQPGTDVAFTVESSGKRIVRIVVLGRAQAENTWKCRLAGQDSVLLSPADLFFESTAVHMRARDVGDFSLSVFPDLKSPSRSGQSIEKAGVDGVFSKYKLPVKPKNIQICWQKTRETDPSGPVKMGKRVPWRQGAVATAPIDSDFARAGVWRISIPKDALNGVDDVFLQVGYVGDVARLYAGGRLLDDDFFKGTVWEIGLKRFMNGALAGDLQLKILPLRKDSPFYIPRGAWPSFPPGGEICDVRRITASPEYEVVVAVGSAASHAR